MGRKRTITEEQLLNAAEQVVVRDGAAQLTLDAVAEQAGVSKASVLYYHGSKDELIEAVVKRGVARDTAFNNTAIERLGNVGDAVMRGRLLAASSPLPSELHAVALSLCSALAQNVKLRTVLQDTQEAVIARIRETSTHPKGAMLAYLALEGLKLLEILDFHPWPEAERRRLLLDIQWLLGVEPRPVRSKPEVGGSSKTRKRAVSLDARPNSAKAR